MSFINRTKERHELSSIMNQANEGNCVIVLAGTTGVGKSGLVQYLLEHELCLKPSVCVRVSKSRPDSIENSHYLNAIYREFCQYAKTHKADAMSPVKHAICHSTSLLRIVISWLKNKAGFPEGSNLFEQPFESNLVQKKDYIVDILKRKHFIIDIENIQNIDIVSLEILSEIIKSINNTVFILEYTTEISNVDSLLNFVNEMKSVCKNTSAYTIERLPFSEARKLASSEVEINDVALSGIYNNSNGNLIQILLANHLMNEQSNPIQSTLANLSKDAKYITYLIYWYGGRISKSHLSMMSSCPYANGASILLPDRMQIILDDLATKRVISIVKSGEYEIAHDSIGDELEHSVLNPQLLIAYSVVKNYLLELLTSSPNDSSIIDTLFTLFIKRGDEDLISILPQIQMNICQSKYPQNAIDKLLFYQSKLEVQGISVLQTSQIIYEQLAAICNDLGLVEYAQNLLDHVYNPDDHYHIALQASIYGWQCNCDAIDTMIENHSKKSRLNLTLFMCKLNAVMMSRTRKESINLSSMLLDKYANCDYIECVFLLRNYAELVDDFYEAIKLYEQCIESFKRFNRNDLIAEVHLSLAMVYAYIADIDEAKNHLHLAHKMSGMINESYLLNNFAVLAILSDNVNDDVQKKLSDALLVNGNEYDRLIIMCNLLICYTRTGKVEQAEDICRRIENSKYQKYQYDELLHIIYTDLLYYYQIVGNKKKSDIYIVQLKKMMERQHVSTLIKELTNSLIYGIQTNQFYSKFPYRVDFLGYWGFRIDPGLRNYVEESETCPHKSSY